MSEKELKDALAKKEVVIGSRGIVRKLKTGNLKMVFIANNCPERIKKDINHYASLSNVKIEEYNGTGEQLGTFCGKPFAIAAIAILK